MAHQKKPTKAGFIKFEPLEFEYEEQIQRSFAYYQLMNKRRSVRQFSEREFPLEIVENAIRTASSAPSGAHKQPWTFCVVRSAEIKKKIREAAEKEEYENYHGRMSDDWLDDLKKFDTNWKKPFLETAPVLIVAFKKTYDIKEGEKQKNYYVNESVGLACGFLLSALHNAGLVSLTHTPSPLNFLANILNRPKNEKPFLLIPVGYPAENAEVPELKRKDLQEVMLTFD
ncbi:MAG: nitroreductase family protein [Vicingaceae bacterium]